MAELHRVAGPPMRFRVRFVHNGQVRQRRVRATDAASALTVLGVSPDHVLDCEPSFIFRGLNGVMTGLARRPAAGLPIGLFSRELSVLLGAGIPLLESLQALREKEALPGAARALDGVIADLRAGHSLSAAVQAQPGSFDSLFAALCSAAERTGQLPEVLAAHARHVAWVDSLRARLVAASLYPLLLVAASMAVLMFLLIVVVPRFAGLLDGLSADTPAASRALLALGELAGAHPLAASALALTLLALPLVAWRQPAVRQRAMNTLWVLPFIGLRLRVLALARLYRTLSMLLSAGVPVMPALTLTRPVLAQPLRASLARSAAAVSRGERLSDALDAEGLATPVARRMLRVGEKSGSVADMLSQAAAFHDDELQRLSDGITRLLSPLLMLLMGGLIGTVVVLLYLPIFQLAEQVQ